MIKKICNYCGKVYIDKCPCRKHKEKRKYSHDNFYDTKAWRRVADTVRERDYYMDRLALYFLKKKPTDATEDTGTYKTLHTFLIDAYGNVRRHGGALLVHHIIPREEQPEKQYDINNLISLNFHTHEFIHQLYNTCRRDEVIAILQAAVEATLP